MKHIRIHSSLLLLFPLFMLLVSCGKKLPESSVVESTTIRAGTMICSSCVSAVKKAVMSVDGVRDVQIDLASKTVEVSYVKGQTGIAEVEHAITAAGYDANDKKRDAAAYEKLPACCKGPVES